MSPNCHIMRKKSVISPYLDNRLQQAPRLKGVIPTSFLFHLSPSLINSSCEKSPTHLLHNNFAKINPNRELGDIGVLPTFLAKACTKITIFINFHQFLILIVFNLYSCVHIRAVCKMIFLSFVSSILCLRILCLCRIIF